MLRYKDRKHHTGVGRRLYSYVLWWESSLCKTPHFQWIYGKLNQIYEKLSSDQMDPKSALGGPKPTARTGRSLLKNWSYTSNPCIYFSILLDWRAHLAKTLFTSKIHKMRIFIENYLHFMKNCIRPPYKKLQSLKSGFIENSNFENNRDPWAWVVWDSSQTHLLDPIIWWCIYFSLILSN